MNPELRSDLERQGWHYVSQRTTPNGLTLYRFGRDPETSALGRFYAYEEERSADGWAMEIEAPIPMGFVVQERMKL